EITEEIIGAAIAVHREMGPGLLESIYEACLAYELKDRGLRFERQKRIPVLYRGVELNAHHRIDLFVERQVIVEVKTVEHIDPVHIAQVLTYLRLTNSHV